MIFVPIISSKIIKCIIGTDVLKITVNMTLDFDYFSWLIFNYYWKTPN